MSSFFSRNLKKTYSRISSASGVWVRDREGNEYLDGCSGAVVCNIGHGVEAVNQAIQSQLSRVAFAHTSQFVSDAGLNLAEKLVALTVKPGSPEGSPGARVYFTSGGSESIETAIKMARGFFVERGEGSRRFVISRQPSYHGSTLGALSATGHPARRQPYESMLFQINQGNWQDPLSGDSLKVPSPYPYRCLCSNDKAGAAEVCNSEGCAQTHADLLEQAILNLGAENVMAFLAEPVVGAALGAAVPHGLYWSKVRQICTKYGVVLIADEVMTGLGRVGTPLGLDLWGVQPDIVALGKGLSAGYLPLGAVIASAPVAYAFEQGSGVFEHGFTYSGHPTACAAGVAVLDYMAELHLIERVRQGEAQLFQRLQSLQSLPIVGDVRGRGYLAGIELVRDKQTKEPFAQADKIALRVAREARQMGLLTYPGWAFLQDGLGDHVMIAPPFTITDDQLDTLFERLERALSKVSAQTFKAVLH